MTSGHDSPWLAGFGRRAEPKVRVIALPYAGGRCTIFRTWPQLLDDDIEVVAVQYPGRGARASERPLVDARDAARQLALALEPLLDVPYAIFGHCFGALVGFELARYLSAAGQPPLRLVASARQAPDLPWQYPILSDLPSDELVAAIAALGGTPPDLLDAPAVLQRALPAFRADLRTEERYSFAPGDPLSCPISVYGGLEDRVSADALAGWGRQSTATTGITWFAGGHFFLDVDPAAVVGQVDADLRTGPCPLPPRPMPEPEATNV